jgi:hypothetical protein
MCGDSHLQPPLTDVSEYKDRPTLHFALSEEYTQAHMHRFTFILSSEYFTPIYSVSTTTDTDWTAGVRFSAEAKEIFLYSTGSRPALEPTQPPIQWVSGALSPVVKGPGREAKHLSPSSAEAENCGAIPPLHHMS